jgi:PDZ domain-containing protein
MATMTTRMNTTGNALTTEHSVPVAPGPAEPPGRTPQQRFRLVVALSSVGLLLVLAVGAAFLRVPYVENLPGSARGVAPLVAVFPEIGVHVVDVADATEEERAVHAITADEGAYVEGVDEGSDAQRAGLAVGDVITRFGKGDVTAASDVTALLRQHTVGQQVEIDVLRAGAAQHLSAELTGPKTYAPKRSVAFTTVSQREATLGDALRGWIDDHIDVIPTDIARGGQSRSENQRYNAQLMDTSKYAAETVALRRIGLPVTIHTTGTVVRGFAEGSPAEASALKLDDVIVAVDGTPLTLADQLRDLLQVGGPGAAHRLTVERPAGSDRHVDVSITTAGLPAAPDRAVIGIYPEERIVGFDFPYDVAIDSGRVGGPSAGLAFTLAILDVLTPGELTGGHEVAVTGTMDFDGNVGPVGGGVQKAIAVRNAGYEAFLVPTDEFAEVDAAVGHDLRVIAVDTLQEALDARASLGGDLTSLGPAGATSGP